MKRAGTVEKRGGSIIAKQIGAALEGVSDWSPNSVLDMLMTKGRKNVQGNLEEKDIQCALYKLKEILLDEPSFLPLSAPIKVVGNIHSQFSEIVRFFDSNGYPPQHSYLFLGGYVNSGPYGMECFMLLACLKIKYPGKVFMLRGSHEFGPMT